MEVLHTVEEPRGKFQFLRDGDNYAVSWNAEGPSRWLSRDAMIRWSLMATDSPTFKEMDKFILNYFPESLVTLIALEKS